MLKTELRTAHIKVKEYESEATKLRNELEMERSRRNDAESATKNESLLRQAYDKISVNLKS